MNRFKNTKEKYCIDGKYSEDRMKLHKKIVDSLFNNKPNKEIPDAILLGGGSASGKSTISELWVSAYKENGMSLTYIDCDEIKKLIPEYNLLKKFNPTIAAIQVHDESSDIAEALLKKCIEEKKNFLYDGTMKNLEKYLDIVEDLRTKSYHIIMTVVDAPLEVAKERAKLRAKETQREVPEHIIEESHKKVPETFKVLKDLVDEYTLYDTRDIVPQIIIEKVDGCSTHIKDINKLKEFYDKSTGSY